MTAEFAIALPAVLLSLALCVGAIQIAMHQVRVTDAAAAAARMLGRGDDPAHVIARAGARHEQTRHDAGIVCVRLSVQPPSGPGALGIAVAAEACALAEATVGSP